MSKERETLITDLSDAFFYIIQKLQAEIRELLPQKREPLSYCAIRAIVNQLPTEVDLDTGIEFCRIIEKAHGIGGGE